MYKVSACKIFGFGLIHKPFGTTDMTVVNFTFIINSNYFKKSDWSICLLPVKITDYLWPNTLKKIMGLIFKQMSKIGPLKNLF